MLTEMVLKLLHQKIASDTPANLIMWDRFLKNYAIKSIFLTYFIKLICNGASLNVISIQVIEVNIKFENQEFIS